MLIIMLSFVIIIIILLRTELSAHGCVCCVVLCEHRFLAEVAAECSTNLMTPDNLAICFAPTLMRGMVDNPATVLEEIKCARVIIRKWIMNEMELVLASKLSGLTGLSGGAGSNSSGGSAGKGKGLKFSRGATAAAVASEQVSSHHGGEEATAPPAAVRIIPPPLSSSVSIDSAAADASEDIIMTTSSSTDDAITSTGEETQSQSK